jgi:hypothetical protein
MSTLAAILAASSLAALPDMWELPATAPPARVATRAEIKQTVRLVVVFATVEQAKPALALKRAGYDVVFAQINDPANLEWIDRLKIDRAKLPWYQIYRGHQAIEVYAGQATVQSLAAWYHRIARGERSTVKNVMPATNQDFLQPEDRRELRWVMSPGTCGMLGCQAHGGGMRLIEVALPRLEEKPRPARPSAVAAASAETTREPVKTMPSAGPTLDAVCPSGGSAGGG